MLNKAENKSKQKEKPQKTKKPEALRDDRLEMLFVIINRNKAEYYIELLKSFEINMQLVVLAHGTASASTLALLRLNDSDKTLLAGAIQASKIKEATETLEQKFKTVRGGAGIAFTVPMTGVIGTLIFGFLGNNRQTVRQANKENEK